jgi:LysR family hydrogen peroxide-inducible transcriptional activator
MVAAGIGITVMPASALGMQGAESKLLRFIPFAPPAPDRRVVLVWRKSFPRLAAIEALAQAVRGCGMPGVTMLEEPIAAAVAD